MALGIYTGGTTGATDGTLVSSGNKLDLASVAIGTVRTLHMRCETNGTNDLTFSLPTGMQVSFDNATWYSGTAAPVQVVGGVNIPVYFKQNSAATTGTATFDTVATFTTDITAPTLSGSLTATVNSSTQVTLSGPTATDAVGIAKWQYKVGTGAWVDIAASNTTTMPSVAVTGLTASTAYTFTVQALDAAGNASTNKPTANATTQAASIAFTDAFTTYDTAKWAEVQPTSTSVDVAGGYMNVDRTNGAADIPYLICRQKLSTASDWTAKMTMRVASWTAATDTNVWMLALSRQATEPTALTNYCLVPYFYMGNDSQLHLQITRINSSNAAESYNFTASTWGGTFGVSTHWRSVALNTFYNVYVQNTAANGVRIIVKAADDTTVIGQTAYVQWTSLGRSGTDVWLFQTGGAAAFQIDNDAFALTTP